MTEAVDNQHAQQQIAEVPVKRDPRDYIKHRCRSCGVTDDHAADCLVGENAHLRALLWRVADAPVAGSNETHYAVALPSDLWRDVMDAAGYDEMGQ